MSNVCVSLPKTCSIMHGVVSSRTGVEMIKKKQEIYAKYLMDVRDPSGIA